MEEYQGLADYVENVTELAIVPSSFSIILPSHFEESPKICEKDGLLMVMKFMSLMHLNDNFNFHKCGEWAHC